MTKKTALVIADNVFHIHNNDEWDSFRAEGRIPINIGFGLSLLGYDVNIVCSSWDLKTSKKTWNDIQLSKTPIQSNYDIALSLSLFDSKSGISFKKGICMVYEQFHITKYIDFVNSTGIQLICTCMNRDFFDPKLGGTVLYLPPLFPIPSINKGFAPLHYNPKPNELNIFMIHSSWAPTTTISGDRFASKEELIINHLKSKGYNVKLSLLVVNRDYIKYYQSELKSSNITTLFYSNECNYRKIIELIQQADICITNGAPVFPGNSLTDIISLGKPLIYIGDGRLNIEWKWRFVSHLYSQPSDIIYIQEPYHDSIQKIDRIMSNPVDSCKKYTDEYKDFDFNNWKHIVKDIFG